MTERKRLSLSRKPKLDTNAASDDESTAKGVLGAKKRRIVITKPEPVKQAKQVQPPKKRKKKKPPSTLRLNALDAELCKLSKVWRSHSPLALGIEKQVFKAIADGQLSASKRVVRALLRKHNLNKNYLVDVVEGASRFNLDGTVAGECTLADAEYSRGMLKRLEIQKIVKKTIKV